MRRHLAPAGIVCADSLLLTYAHPGVVRPWLLPVWALLVAGVLVVARRRPGLAFLLALGPALVTGGAGALLPYTAYGAGKRSSPWLATAVAGFVVVESWRAPAVAPVVVAAVVFALLPLLVGAYVAEQARRAAALARQERLRIARDMHDALGHRLSLVSMQAAALEVGGLPAAQREAVRRLAESARGAAGDLHDVLGGLRAAPAGLAELVELVDRARAAGVPVELVSAGRERELPPEAFRLVQEGLTNGCKHAPGAPITVRAEWQDDALLLSVVNPVPPGTAPAPARGLAGLAERVELAGGLVGHGVGAGEFRLWAVFPAEPVRRPPALLDLVLAGLMFGLVPLSLVIGVAG
ncbi:sensor histidine kinase [Dactylosporangium sp. CA-052675]|uniref:sensor histidine kinase n=1 Tax=Dactylosporangium sp. CA-052675 TaxID=3239927 RepID=UPI003D8A69DC